MSTRTGDHVLARSLFMKSRRANLPKVPACAQCNGEKSRIEHYLATILPFGGRHPDAGPNLELMVPGRLEKNVKLQREIGEGRETVQTKDAAGALTTATTSIPLRGDALLNYIGFVVKGLLWHHWKVAIRPGFGVRVTAPTNVVADQFVSVMRKSSALRIGGDLGFGTVTYEGVQGSDYPELSVWTISMYGGILLSDNSNNSDEQSNLLYAITAKDEFLARPAIVAIFGTSA